MKGHIRRRGEHSWQVILDLQRGEDGKRRQRYITVKGAKRDAQNKLHDLISKVNKGTYADPSRITISELAKQYLELNTNRWSGKTALGYSEKIANYIIPHLGNIRIDRLTASRIDRFLADIQKNGRKRLKRIDEADDNSNSEPSGISPQTAHHCRSILRSMINWGLRKNDIHLEVNPVTNSDSVKVPHEEMNILTLHEANQLVGACVDSIYEMPIILSLYTGMRQGECLGLRWSDIDFEARTITVRSSLEYVNGELSLKEPKNAYSRRTFEITQELVDILKKHREIQRLRRMEPDADYKNLNLVCPRTNGYYMRGNMVSKGLTDIIGKIGIRHIRFHDLRHTHISHSLACGESVIRVSRRVGHANPSITLKRYAHSIPGDLGAPTQFMNALAAEREKSEG